LDQQTTLITISYVGFETLFRVGGFILEKGDIKEKRTITMYDQLNDRWVPTTLEIPDLLYSSNCNWIDETLVIAGGLQTIPLGPLGEYAMFGHANRTLIYCQAFGSLPGRCFLLGTYRHIQTVAVKNTLYSFVDLVSDDKAMFSDPKRELMQVFQHISAHPSCCVTEIKRIDSIAALVRVQSVCLVIQDVVLFMLGFSAANMVTGGIVFDPQKAQWFASHDILPDKLPEDPKRRLCGHCLWQDQITITGGSNETECLKSGFTWHSKNRTWERLPDLPARRHGHTLVSVNDTLILFGGTVTWFHFFHSPFFW
jgi:hypothetical protein